MIAGQQIDEEIALIPKIGGYIQLLVRKGFLTEDMQLTYNGVDLLNNLSAPTVELELKKEKKSEHFTTILHKSLQDILEKNTGKKQAVMAVKTNRYYFLCGPKDLDTYLSRFNKLYPELWNEEKITKVLGRFVEECSYKEKYPMLVQYYILHKDRGSALATALENYEEETAVVKARVAINTKELFG